MLLIIALSSIFVAWILRLALSRYQFAAKVNKIPGLPASTFGLGIRSTIAVFSVFAGRSASWTSEAGFRFLKSSHLLTQRQGLFRVWIGPYPIVYCSTAEIAEQVLSRNDLTTKGMQYRFAKAWLGSGLLTAGGEKWKKQRKILTPAFHFKILESFLPIMESNGNVLITKLDEVLSNKKRLVEDLSELMLSCTLGVICETAMGIEV